MPWDLTGTASDARAAHVGSAGVRVGGGASHTRAGETCEAAGLARAGAAGGFGVLAGGSLTGEAEAAEGSPSGGATRALTVSEAMACAKGVLEERVLVVEGEVSEFNDKPGYKAAYFTIADASCPMACMMWRSAYLKSGVRLRVGERVRVVGRFTVYAPKGRMQFSVVRLAPAGAGDLRQRVDALARRLEAEGLMDPARRRPIPAFCQHVAVVTSPRGKAVHDVIRTLRRRNPLVELLVCGVAVEGADAPACIEEGLLVAAAAHPDAILLVRGGGSYEDLMPFNDEGVARAVAACPVPVVTGIGHEPDTTICDMVADLRRSTPTAAAEAVAPAREELAALLEGQAGRLAAALASELAARRSALDALAARPVLARPAACLIEGRARDLDLAHDRLVRAIPDALASRRAAADAAARELTRAGARLGQGWRARLALDAQRLAAAGPGLLAEPNRVLAVQAGRLDALSPLAVIARGYALATDEAGHVVSSVGRVAPGAHVDVRLADGSLACQVLACEPASGPAPTPASGSASPTPAPTPDPVPVATRPNPQP